MFAADDSEIATGLPLSCAVCMSYTGAAGRKPTLLYGLSAGIAAPFRWHVSCENRGLYCVAGRFMSEAPMSRQVAPAERILRRWRAAGGHDQQGKAENTR